MGEAELVPMDINQNVIEMMLTPAWERRALKRAADKEEFLRAALPELTPVVHAMAALGRQGGKKFRKAIRRAVRDLESMVPLFGGAEQRNVIQAVAVLQMMSR